ncbi:MAG: glycosyltransferase family 2 protein [Candidatus Omnitrophota bacterium]
MKCCVLVPIYNEIETIGMVVESVLGKGLDVVVIDDGSTDGSGENARGRGAVVLSNDVRSGKGAALRRGFVYAIEKNYEGVITMDGDGQHDAKDIDKIIKAAEADPCSIVNGTRMTQVQDMPLLRRVTNRVMSWMISVVCKQRIPDTQCGFRYISADILRRIKLESSGYEIETEVLIKASYLKYPVYSVPVRTIYSIEKSNIDPVKDTIRFFKFFLKAIIYR